MGVAKICARSNSASPLPHSSYGTVEATQSDMSLGQISCDIKAKLDLLSYGRLALVVAHDGTDHGSIGLCKYMYFAAKINVVLQFLYTLPG